MGDQYCLNCGEPWETYYIRHEMLGKYRRMFQRGIGCPSCKGISQEPRKTVEEKLNLTMINLDETEDDHLTILDQFLEGALKE